MGCEKLFAHTNTSIERIEHWTYREWISSSKLFGIAWNDLYKFETKFNGINDNSNIIGDLCCYHK